MKTTKAEKEMDFLKRRLDQILESMRNEFDRAGGHLQKVTVY